MELIQRLMKQLGLDESTARGGLGLVLKVASDKLEGTQFESLKALIPETDALVEEAPSPGLLGGLGGLASSLSGNDNLGNLGELMGGFSKLGLDKEKMLKFADVVKGFVTEKGDDNLKELVGNLLNR